MKRNNEVVKDLQMSLIQSGYVNIYKRYKYLRNLYNKINSEFTCYYNFTEYDLQVLGFLPNLDKSITLACDRLINNKSAKSNNIRKKIEYLISNYKNCVFVTLTFDDDCLKNTNSTTRRIYVKRFFNSQNLKYVANIDFGQDDRFSRREHYHAICSDYVDTSLWSYIINVEKLRVYDSTAVKVSKYINKLVNHAVKDGSCTTRLLASQNFFEEKRNF